VGFDVAEGEVHAVVGENGAGKSTLMRLLAGVYTPDSGSILLDGREVRFRNPEDARQAGIGIVFQELNQFPDLTVSANMHLMREHTGTAKLLRRKVMEQQCTEALAMVGATAHPNQRLGRLSLAERQRVEIAARMMQKPRVLILDEPNSALNEADTQRMFSAVRKLKSEGVSILYISHRMEEVFHISDRISVLRDGEYKGTWRISETSITDIVREMVGRRVDAMFPPLQDVAGNPTAISLQLVAEPNAPPVSLTVKQGEVVGLAGLPGSGPEAVMESLFGLRGRVPGSLSIGDTAPLPLPKSPIEAVERGIAMVPASRRDEGLFMEWSIARNIALLKLNTLRGPVGTIRTSAVYSLADGYAEAFRIAAPNTSTPVGRLSGGNQQKALIARWMAINPKLLILWDPTRGVDVGAREEIYRLVAEQAQKGMGVLVWASEVEETMGLSHRLLVFRKGSVFREFAAPEMRKADVVHSITAGGEQS
jgi:ribose transport system ATP-binding protein